MMQHTDYEAEEVILQHLQRATGTPTAEMVAGSRRKLRQWFARTAPLLQWDVLESPLGLLFVATSPEGLYSLDFGVDEDVFLQHLDPLARTERSPSALGPAARQLREYFAGARHHFELPVDLGRLTPFQSRVLATIRDIPAGALWTYKQVAEKIQQPKASRAVGQALGGNPIPIVIPCHRVIASDGGLGGYSGGGGVESKRWLLKLEKAL